MSKNKLDPKRTKKIVMEELHRVEIEERQGKLKPISPIKLARIYKWLAPKPRTIRKKRG